MKELKLKSEEMHQLLETTVNQLQLQQIEYKDLLVEKVRFYVL